ncbi:lipopolysaccharide core heptose(II) kinase RfaY [Marinobacter sp.]|uniref:lipopolysaccharide core heptose(II) kinase RfaY n=1 Tax=Marinobacter sp. TaxID=50741 RepID=UPI002B26C9FD|nr:lipopolysaccharide core heptose(II) kinase RfaY [Marinobacter sp.]
MTSENSANSSPLIKPCSVTRFQHGPWSLVSSIGESESLGLLSEIDQRQVTYERVFRDNRRTLSARIATEHGAVLLKIPRARNGRRWERILTFFRGSDAVRSFFQLRQMQEMGFSAPYPLMACEKRQSGFVVDAFLCYRFVEGRPAEAEDAGLVLDALRKLHRAGYLRTDAQRANFLIDDDQVVFIDFRLKRSRFFARLQQARELDRFIRSCPEAEGYLTREEQASIWLRLAHRLENFSFSVREFKRVMRQKKQN